MPGSDYLLGGPIFWVATGLLLVEGMLAAFVAIDAARRLLTRREDVSPSRRLYFYLVPQGLYVVLMLLGEVRAVPANVTAAVVLSTPLMFAQSIAYLLRVTFPKPPAVEPADASQPPAEGPAEPSA